MKVIISTHAKGTIKSRLGLKVSAVKRQGKLALERGYRHNQLKGRLLKWVNKKILGKSHSKKDEYIVYNNSLFLFRKIPNEEEPTYLLVTVLKIPANLLKDLEKFIK